MPYWELEDGVMEQYIIDRQREKIGRLQDENDKLRKLARLEHECNVHANLCEFCPHNGLDFEHDDFNCEVTGEIERLRKELGIEAE